jgi:hypothetical protein
MDSRPIQEAGSSFSLVSASTKLAPNEDYFPPLDST